MDEIKLFETLVGGPAQGDWGLRVVDLAARDVGVLVKWGLAITY